MTNEKALEQRRTGAALISDLIKDLLDNAFSPGAANDRLCMAFDIYDRLDRNGMIATRPDPVVPPPQAVVARDASGQPVIAGTSEAHARSLVHQLGLDPDRCFYAAEEINVEERGY